jgi:large exoprotein involved in heme utilization and adhesion
MTLFNSLRCFGLILPLISVLGGAALAQSVIPANGTQVNRQGNRFDIEGGQRSRDGANLFHSFDRFGSGDGRQCFGD